MSETLERIIQQMKALSLDEQRQLAAILKRVRAPGPDSAAERQFEAKLEIERWLSLPAPPPLERPSHQLASPLQVRGQLCSEMLIEERR